MTTLSLTDWSSEYKLKMKALSKHKPEYMSSSSMETILSTNIHLLILARQDDLH